MAEIGSGFNVTLDLQSLRDFEQFADQFPFAISLAMNTTAKKDAVPAMRDGLYLKRPIGAGFQDRMVSYTERGIQFYKASTKRDLTVKVGAISEYLLAATEGTADNSRPPGKSSIGAIPVGPTRQPKHKVLARRNDWPMQLIKRGLAFRPGLDHERKSASVKVTRKDGREGKRKVRDKPAALMPGQVLYGTKKGAHPGVALWVVADDRDVDLPPVYPALPLVKEAFSGSFSDNLYRAIRKAIRTRRRR